MEAYQAGLCLHLRRKYDQYLALSNANAGIVEQRIPFLLKLPASPKPGCKLSDLLLGRSRIPQLRALPVIL